MVLTAAVPLALTAGLMWYQGTGRLATGLVGGGTRRRRQRRRHGGPRATAGASTTRQRRAEDDPWEDSFRTEARREARNRARRQARERARRERAGTAEGTTRGSTASSTGSGRRTRQRAGGAGEGGLTAAEAYDLLGLERTDWGPLTAGVVQRHAYAADVQAVLDELRSEGALDEFVVCKPCAQARGIDEADLAPWATFGGADDLARQAAEHDTTMTF
jgi:hypothetical protein